ncbi:MAG: 1,6-anhydro-N-acetylmuramyl-L-alanine amidase AmpD [Methylococcales bacterium]|nr:1,6-anhydro-N-acetylmuramyl-L-alanine amidase AmpD [Methylococcales bacterium]MCK5924305.1 1,6-anhydro-N-acetylmuramyl-L-alanine amidase AmpD [Methylococcales bacterium]
MRIKNHQLSHAKKIASPNFNDRPDEADISLIVIHNISLPPAQFSKDFVSPFFCNQLDPTAHPYFKEIHALEVSAHVFIRRCGEIIQYVPFNKRAWHAGKSSYQGRENCNDYAIGIELEGIDTLAYTQQQYQQLAVVIQALIQQYPNLNQHTITGHNIIAPERKTDPGEAFLWPLLSQLLEHKLYNK